MPDTDIKAWNTFKTTGSTDVDLQRKMGAALAKPCDYRIVHEFAPIARGMIAAGDVTPDNVNRFMARLEARKNEFRHMYRNCPGYQT